MDPQTIETISKIGVVGVCLFVIWLGWKREERTAQSFENLNTANQQQAKANNDVQKETVQVLTKLSEKIDSRPCMKEEFWDGKHDRRDQHPR